VTPIEDLLGSLQPIADNLSSSVNHTQHALKSDCTFWQPTNQFLPPYGYDFPPSKQSLPGTLQFHYTLPFKIAPSLQTTSSTNRVFPGDGAMWQGNKFPQTLRL